jgi:quinol monooxygenase YgiN
MRLLVLLGWLILAGALVVPDLAKPQNASTQSVTIAMSITAASNASREDVQRALQSLTATVRKQPGLIDQIVLQNVVRSHQPSHVYVTRWRTLAAWEAMLTNAEFRKIADQYQRLVTLEKTAVYMPLEMNEF